MTLLKNSGNPGVAAGTVVTTANSGGTAGDAFTVVSGSTLTFETTGIHVVAAASANSYVGYTGVAGATNAIAARGYLTLPSIPTPNAQVFANFRSGGGGTSFFNLLITASGFVQVLSDASGTALGTTTTALTPGVEYRWEVGATNGTTTTGVVTLRIYVGDSTTVHSSLDLSAVNIGTTTIGHVRFGRPAAIGSAWTYDFRKVAFQTGSATLIGPEVANAAPTANAGTDQTVATGSLVTLTGTATDTDGTISSRLWAQTSGTAVTLSGATSASATFTPTTAGTYVFSFTATDNGGATATDSVTVTVVAPPVVSYTQAKIVEVSATATNGGTLTLTQTSGGTATITGPVSGVFRVVLPSPQTDTVVLSLTATNTGGTDTEVISIEPGTGTTPITREFLVHDGTAWV